MSQEWYVTKIRERFDMTNCKPRTTPCELKCDLTENDSDLIDPRTYREVVGSLIYLMICTRPDISYIIGKLSQHLSKPHE